MFSKIRALYVKHKDIIVYLLLGLLTAVVTFAVYIPLHNVFNLSATVSNFFSWVAAVLFAFVTDKPLVFHSYDWSRKVLFPEFLKFTGSRVLSLIIETAIVYYFADYLKFDGNIVKLCASGLIVALNYFASKLFVFHEQ